MADDEETERKPDVRDLVALNVKLEKLLQQRRELRTELDGARKQLEEQSAKLADFDKYRKETEKLSAERDSLIAEKEGWSLERSIMSAGISDPEGVDFVRLAWDRMKEKPEGGLDAWLGDTESLPKGIRAYLPEKQGDRVAQTKLPDPSSGVRQTKAGAATSDGLPGGAIPGDFRTQRDAVWASMGLQTPRLPGKKD